MSRSPATTRCPCFLVVIIVVAGQLRLVGRKTRGRATKDQIALLRRVLGGP